ncbi:hypothetical protein [Halomarina oriensis]|uniref:Uncharacterized protein n=1 Tax=Halomarina oriensis TaxID=671145 RepID=A0A6B0GP23_9EURY|nr:hypothetical protein [Halomarina oriensis]MWG35279.1 hypothetical protein [Halomarina oriensis]
MVAIPICSSNGGNAISANTPPERVASALDLALAFSLLVRAAAPEFVQTHCPSVASNNQQQQCDESKREGDCRPSARLAHDFFGFAGALSGNGWRNHVHDYETGNDRERKRPPTDEAESVD